MGSRGRSEQRSPPESEEFFLLNLIYFFTFSGLKCSFYCDFVVDEYNKFD